MNANMDFHSMHNRINNLNLTTTPIIGNIIVQNMNTAMLCRAMHHCFFNGVPPQHPTYYFFILVLLSFKIYYEMWTIWSIEFEPKKCKMFRFTNCFTNATSIRIFLYDHQTCFSYKSCTHMFTNTSGPKKYSNIIHWFKTSSHAHKNIT